MESSIDTVVLVAHGIRELTLFALLVAALYGDLRHGRIPNVLTVPAALTGLALAFGLHGLTAPEGGAVEHVLALVVPIGIFGIPYMLGWFGAGDVKLLAAIGALKGLPFVLTAMLFTGLAGGLLALAGLAARALRAAPAPARAAATEPMESNQPSTWTTHLPYGAAIVMGTLAAWLLML